MMNNCRPATPAQRPFGGLARVVVLGLLASYAFLLGVPPAGAAQPPPPPPVDVTATADLKIGSRLLLTITPSPATTSDTVTIVVSVAEIAGNPFPATGRIVFGNGTSVLGTAPLDAGRASWNGQLPAGTHVFIATYVGDIYYTQGASPAVTFYITAPGPIALDPGTQSESGAPAAYTEPDGVLRLFLWAAGIIGAGLALLAAASHLRRPRFHGLRPSSR